MKFFIHSLAIALILAPLSRCNESCGQSELLDQLNLTDYLQSPYPNPYTCLGKQELLLSLPNTPLPNPVGNDLSPSDDPLVPSGAACLLATHASNNMHCWDWHGLGSGGVDLLGCDDTRCTFLSITNKGMVVECDQTDDALSGKLGFVRSEFSPVIEEFVLNYKTGEIELLSHAPLTYYNDSDAVKEDVSLNGLPYYEGDDATNGYLPVTVDVVGSEFKCTTTPIDIDQAPNYFGMDPGGIQRVWGPYNENLFVVVEENSPSIAFVSADPSQYGRLLHRYVPDGYWSQIPAEISDSSDVPTPKITQSIPSYYKNRYKDRGFKAVACNQRSTSGGYIREGFKCWAFIETPLRPGIDDETQRSYVYRVLEIDYSGGYDNAVMSAEYVVEATVTPKTSYDKSLSTCTNIPQEARCVSWNEPETKPVDLHLSAAFYIEDKKIAIMERANDQVLYWCVDFTSATNVFNRTWDSVENLFKDDPNTGCPVNNLIASGIKPGFKTLIANSANVIGWSASYDQSGFALVGNSVVTISDNKFGVKEQTHATVVQLNDLCQSCQHRQKVDHPPREKPVYKGHVHGHLHGNGYEHVHNGYSYGSNSKSKSKKYSKSNAQKYSSPYSDEAYASNPQYNPHHVTYDPDYGVHKKNTINPLHDDQYLTYDPNYNKNGPTSVGDLPNPHHVTYDPVYEQEHIGNNGIPHYHHDTYNPYYEENGYANNNHQKGKRRNLRTVKKVGKAKSKQMTYHHHGPKRKTKGKYQKKKSPTIRPRTEKPSIVRHPIFVDSPYEDELGPDPNWNETSTSCYFNGYYMGSDEPPKWIELWENLNMQWDEEHVVPPHFHVTPGKGSAKGSVKGSVKGSKGKKLYKAPKDGKAKGGSKQYNSKVLGHKDVSQYEQMAPNVAVQSRNGYNNGSTQYNHDTLTNSPQMNLRAGKMQYSTGTNTQLNAKGKAKSDSKVKGGKVKVKVKVAKGKTKGSTSVKNPSYVVNAKNSKSKSDGKTKGTGNGYKEVKVSQQQQQLSSQRYYQQQQEQQVQQLQYYQLEGEQQVQQQQYYQPKQNQQVHQKQSQPQQQHQSQPLFHEQDSKYLQQQQQDQYIHSLEIDKRVHAQVMPYDPYAIAIENVENYENEDYYYWYEDYGYDEYVIDDEDSAQLAQPWNNKNYMHALDIGSENKITKNVSSDVGYIADSVREEGNRKDEAEDNLEKGFKSKENRKEPQELLTEGNSSEGITEKEEQLENVTSILKNETGLDT